MNKSGGTSYQCNDEQELSILSGNMSKPIAYHLKEPPEQKSHSDGFGAGKIKLIAQGWSKNKIIHI